MPLIARDLTVEIAAKTIVRGVSFDVRAGDKVGLVGRNGAGKTTLFKTLGGANPASGGTIRRADSVGYLSQDPRSDSVPDDTNCLTHVLAGRGLDEAAVRLEKLRLALEEDASSANINRYSAAQEHFEHLGGYAAESEVRKIVDGLGLRADRLDLTLGALSGGERRRLELARILFAGSELLLLDEPTNHLDANARDWLLSYMRNYRGALLVISHDLELLDDAITRVLHLDRETEEATGTLVAYNGTYSQYVRAREEDESRQAKVAVRQTKEIQRLSTLADSMRGQTAKRARVAKIARRSRRTARARTRRGPQEEARAQRPVAGATARRPHGDRGERFVEVVRRARRVLRRHVRRRPQRARARARAQRRGQDHAAAGARRSHRGRPRRCAHRSPHAPRLLRTGARGHRRRAVRSSSTSERSHPSVTKRSVGSSACSG